MKMKVLGTGLSGLVGSRVVELLSGEYEFEDLSLTTGVNIINYNDLLDRFKNSKASVILHMAAKTDVDGCEDDKILLEEGSAWMVNVEGTQNIVEAAKKTGKRVVYISTDFVFDGTKEFYTEQDEPNPVSWYATTKHEGEKVVKRSGLSYAIVRIAYPYRPHFREKKDFVRRMLEKMGKGEKIFALTDHIFTPTFIDDIAVSLSLILKKDTEGIYHVVGSQSLTTYDAAKLIAKIFGLKANIEAMTRSVYFKDRAFRPFKLVLKNDKITKLGVKMKRFDEGLLEMKKQMGL